jgi:hypothetical protein
MKKQTTYSTLIEDRRNTQVDFMDVLNAMSATKQREAAEDAIACEQRIKLRTQETQYLMAPITKLLDQLIKRYSSKNKKFYAYNETDDYRYWSQSIALPVHGGYVGLVFRPSLEQNLINVERTDFKGGSDNPYLISVTRDNCEDCFPVILNHMADIETRYPEWRIKTDG